MTLALDFEGKIFEKLYHSNKRVDWHGTKRMGVDRMLDPSCDFKLWPHPWPWPWIFMIKFLIAIFQEWEGRLTWNERDATWIQCCMHNGLVLGHSAWQKVRPSNGSMWNSYSFQPIGPWMGYSFTDLGAEGCCRSLNALLTLFPSSYHHEIFRSYYQWQMWPPCNRSRSEVKGQGQTAKKK